MTALLKSQPRLSEYELAMQQWLSGEVSGHLGAYMYINDNDDNRWKSGHSADTYYLGRDDKATFDLVLKDLNIFTKNLFDLGPGGDSAVNSKTIPLAKTIKAANYYPIDLSQILADSALKMVGHSLNIAGKSIVADFFETLPIKKSNTLLALMGGTVGNIETHTTSQSLKKRLIGIFSNYRKATLKNSYFLVSFDANSNVQEVLDCYQNDEFGALVRSCVERSINTDGFDYDVIWTSHNYQLATGLRSNRNQIIKLGGEEFAIEEGEFFSVLNSYRFPVSFIKEAAEQAGWTHRQTWSATGRVHYVSFE